MLGLRSATSAGIAAFIIYGSNGYAASCAEGPGPMEILLRGFADIQDGLCEFHFGKMFFECKSSSQLYSGDGIHYACHFDRLIIQYP